jgi:hypothetical protein
VLLLIKKARNDTCELLFLSQLRHVVCCRKPNVTCDTRKLKTDAQTTPFCTSFWFYVALYTVLTDHIPLFYRNVQRNELTSRGSVVSLMWSFRSFGILPGRESESL